MKKLLQNTLLLLIAIFFLNNHLHAERVPLYARSGAVITLEIEWNADNYGDIQWQRSTDNGETWTDINNATGKTCQIAPQNGYLYRAQITGQDICEPIYMEEREIKLISFSVDVLNITPTSVEFELKNVNLNGAEVVEHGFVGNRENLDTRSHREKQHILLEGSLPDAENFTLTCEGLSPATSYIIQTYFKTADGSMIYGTEKSVKTTNGLSWTSEDWILEKNAIAARFELKGLTAINTEEHELEFKFGTSTADLTAVAFSEASPNSFQYVTNRIENLQPNTSYIAQVQATIDGTRQTLTKEIKTLSDYSDFPVDATVKEVEHTIQWDANKTLNRISPEGQKAEYPRIIRVSQDTLLCSYHGGREGWWVNIYLQKSYDNGRSWTDPVILMDKERSKIGEDYYRFVNPEMIKLQNGWILMSFVGNGSPETNENCHVMVIISKDNGETWGDPVIVGRGRTWEPMVVQLPNGELEMFIASEAAWWPKVDYVAQEIMYSRSTDNGETWTEFKRACYSPDRRDGMPVGVVMQGNKGVLFAIEVVDDNGYGSPSIVRRDLDGEWDDTSWDGKDSENRWYAKLGNGVHGGAPYILQLPTGEFVLMAHSGGRNNIWQTGYPYVGIGNSEGKGFSAATTVPITSLPAKEGLYYNSLFLKDEETIWLVMTNCEYDGTTRIRGEIKYLEGKIVKH